MKNNDKISVARVFLDPIKNRVSVKSVYVEAVYLEALLYILRSVQKFEKNFIKDLTEMLLPTSVESKLKISSDFCIDLRIH